MSKRKQKRNGNSETDAAHGAGTNGVDPSQNGSHSGPEDPIDSGSQDQLDDPSPNREGAPESSVADRLLTESERRGVEYALIRIKTEVLKEVSDLMETTSQLSAQIITVEHKCEAAEERERRATHERDQAYREVRRRRVEALTIGRERNSARADVRRLEGLLATAQQERDTVLVEVEEQRGRADRAEQERDEARALHEEFLSQWEEQQAARASALPAEPEPPTMNEGEDRGGTDTPSA